MFRNLCRVAAITLFIGECGIGIAQDGAIAGDAGRRPTSARNRGPADAPPAVSERGKAYSLSNGATFVTTPGSEEERELRRLQQSETRMPPSPPVSPTLEKSQIERPSFPEIDKLLNPPPAEPIWKRVLKYERLAAWIAIVVIAWTVFRRSNKPLPSTQRR
jgi:hypothetical protein